MTDGERALNILDLAAESLPPHWDPNDLEIDSDICIAEGDDNGAFVRAWMWVDFTGTELCKDHKGDTT